MISASPGVSERSDTPGNAEIIARGGVRSAPRGGAAPGPVDPVRGRGRAAANVG